MGFFKKDDIQEKEVQSVKEIKTETKGEDKSISIKKNLSLFDVDTIEYVIKNFPTMSIEIQNGLNNLGNILENTIDYIEDKSSEVIKKNRDFKLSQYHRDTAIAIYDVVENLGEYVKWMQDVYENNIENKEHKEDKINSETEECVQKNNMEEVDEDLINQIVDKEEIEIYKDFTLKEPKAFKLDSNIIMVEDWDDLLVKTAEVLTKQYRENKNSNIIVEEIKPIEKKSSQNSFRDTVIDMLKEYKISLDKFKIIIK